ncbi:hypothetical protein L6452_02058 [Arctium lappa]|uniref:Uncharacterized protein n=1 Tax=Arctium lappa TaxID=4217 RepID=A0ACB9FID2_ARCLA|nr:hypothetical protein L6452_02058 [Arctium lappa]
MANVVADALSQRSHGGGAILSLTGIDVVSSLVEYLKTCQLEALREENLKAEVMVKQRELLLKDGHAAEKKFVGPEIVHETADKVKEIRERLRVAQDRKKSYANKKRRPIEFPVGDRVMLKVSPWKGIIRFGKRKKLSPRVEKSDEFYYGIIEGRIRRENRVLDCRELWRDLGSRHKPRNSLEVCLEKRATYAAT